MSIQRATTLQYLFESSKGGARTPGVSHESAVNFRADLQVSLDPVQRDIHLELICHLGPRSQRAVARQTTEEFGTKMDWSAYNNILEIDIGKQ
jgi:hypothetical protein